MPTVFSILNIWADGYGRIAHIRTADSAKEFFVSFLEYDEYMETGKSTKRMIGDRIKGNLKITLVMDFQDSNEELSYYQNTANSPHMEAVVELINVIDSFSISAYLKGYDAPIIVEFEKQLPMQLPSKIKLWGELQIDVVND